MQSRIRKTCIRKAGLLALLVAAMLASSCAGGAKAKDSEPETGAKAIESEANGSGPGAKDSGAVFSDVRGKEWVLAEVKGTAETIRLDRQQLEAAGFKGAYTLTFNEGLLNGTGAPNSYRGPYTAGEGRSLTIGNIAATLMMGLSEVPGIPERSYFAYLNKVARWDIREGNLELYTSDEAGAERVLVYNPK